MISVVVLTLNEEENLPGLFKSIPWVEDFHIVDSGSEDETLTIADHFGAVIHARPFMNYADQRNYALSIDFKYPWVLMMDADERLSIELFNEIRAAIDEDEQGVVEMLCMRRKDYFMDSWMKRASGYPTWFPRVFKASSVTVTREINEIYECSGEKKYLRENLIHYPFNKGVSYWFERHNNYSTREARLLLQNDTSFFRCVSNVFKSDALERRAALKSILYIVPCRPLLVFVYLYFVRFGFLDGKSGIAFASMRAAYEVMINVKLEALRSGEKI